MEKMQQTCIITGAERETLRQKAVEIAAATLCERPQSGAPCRQCRHCRKVLEGIHPDVSLVERLRDKEGKTRRELVVEQIRALSADASVLPNEAERKVYILPEAERMNENAQNAFLKLLEEPPAYVRFLLCAENAALLLPTVRSRCTVLRVAGGETVLTAAARQRAQELLETLGDSAAQLRCCTRLEKLDGSQLRELLEALRLLAPQKLQSRELLALETELERLQSWARVNVGVKHILSMLSTYEMRNDS